MKVDSNWFWDRWFFGVSWNRYHGETYVHLFFGPLAVFLEFGEYEVEEE